MQTAVAEILSSLAKRRDEALPGSVRAAFESDPDRFARFHVKVDDLLYDYSKQNVSVDIIEGLVAVAKTAAVEAKRDAMMSGAVINPTENSAALHTALRDLSSNPIFVGGVDVFHESRTNGPRCSPSRKRCEPEPYAAPMTSRSLTWSTSAPAVRISGLQWPRAPCRCLFRPACGFTMFPTSMAPTSPTPSRRLIRVARCSSSLPRHSPPWRR